MALKFASEAERQEVVARHADLYRRAREGEITADELVRLSEALLKPYRKRKEKAGWLTRAVELHPGCVGLCVQPVDAFQVGVPPQRPTCRQSQDCIGNAPVDAAAKHLELG